MIWLTCPTCHGTEFVHEGDRHTETRGDRCPNPECCEGRVLARTGETPQTSAGPGTDTMLAAAPPPGPDAREDWQTAPEKPSLFLEGHLNDLCLAGEHPVQRERRAQAPDPAPRSQADAGALEDLARLSAKATQGEASAPSWGTDFRIGGKLAGMTSPAGDGSGMADRAFIVALVNAYRSGLLAPRSDRPLSAAPGGEEIARALRDIRKLVNRYVAGHPDLETPDDHVGWLDEGLCSVDRALTAVIVKADALAQTPALRSGEASFQARNAAWMERAFDGDPTDLPERVNRMAEEALELGQALGQSRKDAHALVDYVHDRPQGEPGAEFGGLLTTTACLAAFAGHDLMAAGGAELARISTPAFIAKLREKRATRHGRGPLPGYSAPGTSEPVAPPTAPAAEEAQRPLRAADCVIHEPSGERWIVAYSDPVTGYMSPCGWPDSEARISDCRRVHAATDEEHVALLRDLKLAGGRRGSVALRLYGDPDAPPAPSIKSAEA